MVTCSKTYSDIPFAHRQPKHSGHCSMIHGHNWSFQITFGAIYLDECGFVVDFGRLQKVKDLILMFDHTLVLNADDEMLAFAGLLHYADIVVVPDCSCEGLAKWVAEHVDEIVRRESMGRVFVVGVVCFEDSKNSATYEINRKTSIIKTEPPCV